MKTKEDEMAYFRMKLRPYVSEVMNRINEEETQRLQAVNRRVIYDVVRKRERNS